MLCECWRMWYILLVSIYFSQIVGQSLKDLPEECFTATSIYDSTRVFGEYTDSKYDDLSLRKGWYRFAGRLANSLMEGFVGLQPADKNSNICGALYPGTLMSTHPTVKEGIAAAEVCFRKKSCYHKNLDECGCKSKRTIYVQNCVRHFIYWLVPTARYERYCTSRTWLSKPIKSRNQSDAIECKNYKTIRDASRIWDSPSPIMSETEEGWVRFGESSGGEMASKCTPQLNMYGSTLPCGATFRGWLDGNHPSLREGRVMRRVCFSYSNLCTCEIYTTVVVRNCGQHFVYYLSKPPIDFARYCGASLDSRSIISETNKPYQYNKNICKSPTVVDDIERLWGYTDPTVSKCDANLYGVFKFTHKTIPFAMKEGCNKTDMMVIENRCAGLYQGFMEGRHPTVSEGYVERIVCFQFHRAPCECYATTVIGVQNCGDAYVYDLKSVPLCDARFCMTVDADRTTTDLIIRSEYGAPSNYEPIFAPLAGEFNDDTAKDQIYTILLLLLIILFLFVLLIVLIAVTVCVLRPLLHKESK